MARPEQLRRRKISDNNRIGNLSFPSKALPHSILLNFKKYDYSKLYDNVKENDGIGGGNISTRSINDVKLAEISSEQSIELPLPKQLSDSTVINAGAFERTLAGEALANAFSSGADKTGNMALNAAKDILSGFNKAGNVFANMATGDFSAASQFKDDVGKSAAYFLRNQMDGVTGKTISNVQGNAINPKETMAFNGVQLKTHAFTWELFPSNESDSEQIKNIVRMIKANILPATGRLAGLVNRAFLEYPSLVDIYLLGIDENYFFKYKPCMVTAFNVTYTGGEAMPILKGGKPAMVIIEMTLSEMQIHTKDDIDDVDFEKDEIALPSSDISRTGDPEEETPVTINAYRETSNALDDAQSNEG